MTKELMNEAERFLLEHWEEARVLEESMAAIRTKYKELFERVTEAVREAHPELDATRAIPTQRWSNGEIGFGRKSWAVDKHGNPSGLWMSGLRLELLAAEDSKPPSSYIWLSERV